MNNDGIANPSAECNKKDEFKIERNLGYAQVWRSILKHPLFIAEPKLFHFYCHIFFDANHTPTKDVARGFLKTSINKLSKSIGLNRSQVIRYMKILRDNGLIDIESQNKGGTVYRVMHYDPPTQLVAGQPLPDTKVVAGQPLPDTKVVAGQPPPTYYKNELRIKNVSNSRTRERARQNDIKNQGLNPELEHHALRIIHAARNPDSDLLESFKDDIRYQIAIESQGGLKGICERLKSTDKSAEVVTILSGYFEDELGELG